MTLEPFLDAGLIIQTHIVAALLAFALGIRVLWRRKGTAVHRREGKIWIALMAVVALSSFFIHEIRMIGLFSPIHLLSVVTLTSLFLAVRTIRRGNVRRHKSLMTGLFFGGLVVAGAFTFLPGRIMHQILFGNPQFYTAVPSFAWILILSGAILLGTLVYRRSGSAS